MFFKARKKAKDKEEQARQEQRDKELKDAENRQQFNNAIEIAKHYINSKEYSKEEKINLLKYIADVVKRDMQSGYIVDLFYHSNPNLYVHPFFPFGYHDEEGNYNELIPDEPKFKRISLKDNVVFTFPWDSKRMKNSLLNILKNKFTYFHYNHWAYYYEGLDVCEVYNGNHSIASGIYKSEGYIEAKVVDIKPLFYHIKTDGVNFFNIHTGNAVEDILDFRVAILFQVSKMIYDLEVEP